jgi:hypothetical protein
VRAFVRRAGKVLYASAWVRARASRRAFYLLRRGGRTQAIEPLRVASRDGQESGRFSFARSPSIHDLNREWPARGAGAKWLA